MSAATRDALVADYIARMCECLPEDKRAGAEQMFADMFADMPVDVVREAVAEMTLRELHHIDPVLVGLGPSNRRRALVVPALILGALVGWLVSLLLLLPLVDVVVVVESSTDVAGSLGHFFLSIVVVLVTAAAAGAALYLGGRALEVWE